LAQLPVKEQTGSRPNLGGYERFGQAMQLEYMHLDPRIYNALIAM
jgi:hypothetical protein